MLSTQSDLEGTQQTIVHAQDSSFAENGVSDQSSPEEKTPEDSNVSRPQPRVSPREISGKCFGVVNFVMNPFVFIASTVIIWGYVPSIFRVNPSRH